jgi:KRAB domain-containing zinc finger protein
LWIIFFRNSELCETTKPSNKTDKKKLEYKCLECKKAFVYPLALKHHQVMHSKIRSFVCDICGHSSKTKQNLKKHMQTHFQLRKFQCNYCRKGFNNKSYLAIHQ